MSKTQYIVVINPQIFQTAANNPEQAEQEYRKINPLAKDIAVIPRNQFNLNGKKVPYK